MAANETLQSTTIMERTNVKGFVKHDRISSKQSIKENLQLKIS